MSYYISKDDLFIVSIESGVSGHAKGGLELDRRVYALKRAVGLVLGDPWRFMC